MTFSFIAAGFLSHTIGKVFLEDLQDMAEKSKNVMAVIAHKLALQDVGTLILKVRECVRERSSSIQ